MKFSDWITRKYVEWRGDSYGREKTVTEFAEYIGVSQQLLSAWMSPDGYAPKTQDAISKLAVKYGLEVYDILGIKISDAELDLWEFRFILQVLTDEEREELKRLGYLMLDKPRQAEIRERIRRYTIDK